jgi:hypothetical protein
MQAIAFLILVFWLLAQTSATRRQEERLKNMSKDLDDLKDLVAKEVTVAGSLRVLLGSVKGQLDAAIAKLSSVVPVDDTADLRALSASLLADVDANAAALVANTPADPAVVPPAPEPTPAPEPAPAPVPVPEPAPDATSTPADPGAGSTSEPTPPEPTPAA